MKQKIKGQALALVLIIVILAVIVVLSVTSRVITDVKQQGLEKASSRAKTLSESAVDNITQQIQNGQIVITTNSKLQYGIANVNPTVIPGATLGSPLGICTENNTDLSKQCTGQSNVLVTAYNKIIRFKINNSEDIEGHLFAPNVALVTSGADSRMIVSTSDNESLDISGSTLLVRAFSRTTVGTKNVTKLVGECAWKLSTNAADCQPAGTVTATNITCPDTARYGSICKSFTSTGVTFYRVKALLKEKAGGTPNPYIELSILGPNAQYDFPVPQMAFIRAGVFTGEQANSQGIFQETNRLVLLNPEVPEAVDYVLYNGSTNPIVK